MGRLLDADGQPIAAANIQAEGRSYLGNSYASTNMSGDFCLEARVSSVVELSTLVRVGGREQALAVSLTTPRMLGSCGQPSQCYMLPDPLVAVGDEPLCDPA